MPLSTATITLDLEDKIGDNFDPRRVKVWVTTNAETIVDTDGNKIRIGSGNVTINADGTASADVWVPGVGSNPASWQTTFHVDYVDRNTRTGRKVQSFGPFTITASGDLADLIEEQAVPPEYAGQIVAEMEALRDETAAISGLTGEDDAVAYLVENPSATKDALSATFATRLTPEKYGAVGDGVADDTTAVRACFEAAAAFLRPGLTSTIKHPGATVALSGTYSLATLAAPIDVMCNVESNRAAFVVPAAYAGVAVRVGHTTSGHYLQAADVNLPDVVKAPTTIVAGSVGVRTQNIGDSTIRFGRTAYFETGINLSGDGQGTAYNTLAIGWVSYCKVALSLKPHVASGWANQNTFVGGSVQQSPGYNDGTTTGIRRPGWRHVVLDGSAGNYVNGNTFLGTSFEGDASEYWLYAKSAADNHFIGTRHEQGTAGVPVTVSGDTLTKVGHGLVVGDMITFNASVTPTGMVLAAPYFVVAVPSADTLKVAQKKGGAALTFSSAGTSVVYFRPPRAYFDLAGSIMQNNTVEHPMTQQGVMEVAKSAAGGSNLLVRRPGWQTADTFAPEDIPLFRARNSSGTAGLTRAVFAAYPSTVDPVENPKGWTSALSDLGVMFATSEAETGRLTASSTGVLKWKRPADGSSFDVPSAVRNQAGALSISGLSCAANTTTTTTVTLTGASVNDHVKVTMLSHVAGIVFSHAYVSAANTLTLVFGNLTAAPISLTTTVEAMVFRRYY